MSKKQPKQSMIISTAKQHWSKSQTYLVISSFTRSTQSPLDHKHHNRTSEVPIVDCRLAGFVTFSDSTLRSAQNTLARHLCPIKQSKIFKFLLPKAKRKKRNRKTSKCQLIEQHWIANYFIRCIRHLLTRNWEFLCSETISVVYRVSLIEMKR